MFKKSVIIGVSEKLPGMRTTYRSNAKIIVVIVKINILISKSLCQSEMRKNSVSIITARYNLVTLLR